MTKKVERAQKRTEALIAKFERGEITEDEYLRRCGVPPEKFDELRKHLPWKR